LPQRATRLARLGRDRHQGAIDGRRPRRHIGARKRRGEALTTNDPQALHALSEHDLLGFMFTAQSGLSDEAYDAAARDWPARARHPRFKPAIHRAKGWNVVSMRRDWKRVFPPLRG